MCSLCGVLLNESWAEQAGDRRARATPAAAPEPRAVPLRPPARRVGRPRVRPARPDGPDRGGRGPERDLARGRAARGAAARPPRSRPPRCALPKTPVTLVTGFLGSGKTTLISRLLGHPDMGETAVIVNELGEVGIDHHLLRRVDERTVLLRSGCVCCTLRGDLADELRDLLSRRERGEIPPFRRVVVETTGLADPAPDRLHAPLRAGRPAPLRARDGRGDGRRRPRPAPRRVAEAGGDRRHARRDEGRPRRDGAGGGPARAAEPDRGGHRGVLRRRRARAAVRAAVSRPARRRAVRSRARGRHPRGRACSSTTSSTGPRSASG